MNLNTSTFRKISTQVTATVEVDSPAFNDFMGEINHPENSRYADVELISSQLTPEALICKCSKCRKASDV